MVGNSLLRLIRSGDIFRNNVFTHILLTGVLADSCRITFFLLFPFFMTSVNLFQMMWHHYFLFWVVLSKNTNVLETQFSGVRISSLLSAGGNLQLALGWFASDYKTLRIIISKSEAMVLHKKSVEWNLSGLGISCCPKSLCICFMSEGRKEQETGRLIGEASAVIQTLHCSAVVKRELGLKVKLSVYGSFYISTLIWATTSG